MLAQVVSSAEWLYMDLTHQGPEIMVDAGVSAAAAAHVRNQR